MPKRKRNNKKKKSNYLDLLPLEVLKFVLNLVIKDRSHTIKYYATVCESFYRCLKPMYDRLDVIREVTLSRINMHAGDHPVAPFTSRRKDFSGVRFDI
jgi:hypothetical protein